MGSLLYQDIIATGECFIALDNWAESGPTEFYRLDPRMVRTLSSNAGYEYMFDTVDKSWVHYDTQEILHLRRAAP